MIELVNDHCIPWTSAMIKVLTMAYVGMPSVWSFHSLYLAFTLNTTLIKYNFYEGQIGMFKAKVTWDSITTELYKLAYCAAVKT